MSNRAIINAGILIAGVLGLGLFAVFGFNKDTKNVKEQISEVHLMDDGHDHEVSSAVTSPIKEDIVFPASEFDQEIDLALANIKKGEEEKNQFMMMNEGIMKILAISRQDTNNVRANYYLALFAIQSGQLEKAEKRLEKLILLQPENQEYSKMLSDLREQQKK